MLFVKCILLISFNKSCYDCIRYGFHVLSLQQNLTLTDFKSINSHNSLGLRMTCFQYDYITIDFKQHEIMQIIMIACAMFLI